MTYTEQVIKYLRTTIGSNACMVGCADAIGTNVTTLSRKLKNEGQSYFKLSDTEKKNLVHKTLEENPRTPAWELADLCGLSCSQTMTRTFQRWHGVNLSEYKKIRSAEQC